MTKEEFDKKVMEVTPEGRKNPGVTDREYAMIEKVYTFHPSISETDGKRQMAELYVEYGMALIMDMVLRAETMEKKEKELREAQAIVKEMQVQIDWIKRGKDLMA